MRFVPWFQLALLIRKDVRRVDMKIRSKKSFTYLTAVNCCRHQNNLNVRIFLGQQHSNDDEQKIHVFITFVHFVEHNVCVLRQRFHLNQFFQQYTGRTECNPSVSGHESLIQANLIGREKFAFADNCISIKCYAKRTRTTISI